jgi:hypothetical protein
MGPIGCPETSVRNYHYSLRNTLEERGSQLLYGCSLKSRKLLYRVIKNYCNFILSSVLKIVLEYGGGKYSGQ